MAMWPDAADREGVPCGSRTPKVENYGRCHSEKRKKIYPNTNDGKKAKKKKKDDHVSDEPKANLQITDRGIVAVQEFNLDIADKEFIVLVGPSGCGKSTTLRMVAGLEEISEGELYIGDKLMNDVAPKDRDIAMVFQNYALYPHMTVYENMAFSLKLRNNRADGAVIAGVRPQHIHLEHGGIAGQLEVAEMMGSEQHLHINIGGTEVVAIVPTTGTGNRQMEVAIDFLPECVQLFDPETEMSLLRV